MKKIVNITEEDIIRVTKQVIAEQSKRKIRKQGRKRQTANIQKYLEKLANSDMNLKQASKKFSDGGEENDVHAMLLLLEGLIKAQTLVNAAVVIQKDGSFKKSVFNRMMGARTFEERVEGLLNGIKYLRKERNDVRKYLRPIKRKVDNVVELINTISRTGDLPEGAKTPYDFLLNVEQLKNFGSTVYSYLK